MSKPSLPQIITTKTPISDIASLLEQRRAVLVTQKSEIEALMKDVETRDRAAGLAESDVAEPQHHARLYLQDVSSQIEYVEKQTVMLERVEKALLSDDVTTVKEAVREYLAADMNLSLKNISLMIYDNEKLAETIKDSLF